MDGGQPMPTPSTDPPRKNADVLYVDDDTSLRGAASDILREEGYTVEEAGNGAMALAYLGNASAPRVIILDLNMPVMGGREFLRHLRKEPELSDVPVLVVSGDVRSNGAVARPEGVIPQLAKPFDVEDLVGSVHVLTRRSRLN